MDWQGFRIAQRGFYRPSSEGFHPDPFADVLWKDGDILEDELVPLRLWYKGRWVPGRFHVYDCTLFAILQEDLRKEFEEGSE